MNKFCDTPEKCYVLGLLWADGYLGNNPGQKITIENKEEDLILLESLFKGFGEYSVYKRKRENRKPQMTIRLSDSELKSFLISVGYQNKSQKSAYEVLNAIPKELRHYWFRGFFDGDGCFYVGKNSSLKQGSLTGSYNQNYDYLTDLLNLLNVRYGIRKVKNLNSSYSQVRFCGKENIRKFGEYIYQGEEFGLERKKEKYLKCLQ